MKQSRFLAFSLVLLLFSVTGAQQTQAATWSNLKGFVATPLSRATRIAGASRRLSPANIFKEQVTSDSLTGIKTQMSHNRRGFVRQAAPPPGFCESLKTLVAAKDFRYNGPMASVRIPGAQFVSTDERRGYFAIFGEWSFDANGKVDPRDQAMLLKRFDTVAGDVAACFPDWKHATIVESESRPELLGGSAFVKAGRIIEVQFYDDLDVGLKLRIQVLAPGALAAVTQPSRDICPALDTVIAAQGIKSDFASLKKSPVTPAGALSSRVIETPRGNFYEAEFAEFHFTGDAPPPERKKEIMEEVQTLTVDISQCLSRSEWKAAQVPSLFGDFGSVEFSRGRTVVKSWGYITKTRNPFGGKPEEFKNSVKVVLIVRENKPPR